MYNRYFVIIGTLALSVNLHLLVTNDYVYAQGNQSGGNSSFTPNNNMTNGIPNNTGIMKNTSGLLDDAFGTLRDTFGSFFENR